MPWEQTSAMDQRVQFISDWLSQEYRKTELCTIYGISRPTADKWINRYQEGGVQALQDRSRAAGCHPNETPEEIREMIIATKLNHQGWGRKKFWIIWVIKDRNCAGLPIPRPVPFSSEQGWSSAVYGVATWRRTVNRLAIVMDPIRSGVRTLRETFCWAMAGAATRLR